MKKLYLTIPMVFMAIAAMAQNSQTSGTSVLSRSKTETVIVDQEKAIVNEDHAVTKSTENTQKASSQETGDKIKITKAELDNQSVRGREYILAHPEKYIIVE